MICMFFYYSWVYLFNMGIVILREENHLSFTVSVQSKGLVQTLTPLHDCSNEHHWGPHFSFLKIYPPLPRIQCTILVLIFYLDNSIVLVFLLLAHCILFLKPII